MLIFLNNSENMYLWKKVINTITETTTQVCLLINIKWKWTHVCRSTYASAEKKLFIPINHFKNTSTLFLNTCCCVLCRGEILKAFYLNFMLGFLFSPFFPSILLSESRKNCCERAENWKWVEEWTSGNFEFRASMNEFEYRYICCFWNSFVLPHHAFISALNVTEENWVKNDVAHETL